MLIPPPSCIAGSNPSLAIPNAPEDSLFAPFKVKAMEFLEKNWDCSDESGFQSLGSTITKYRGITFRTKDIAHIKRAARMLSAPLSSNYPAPPSRGLSANIPTTQGQSRKDQLPETIDYRTFRLDLSGKDSIEINGKKITRKMLEDMKARETIRLVNDCSSRNISWPLSFCGLVIKKYSAKERLGKIEDAEELYNFILSKHPQVMAEPGSEEARDIHSEMILVYARRKDAKFEIYESKVKDIYNNYPHTYTRNSLMEFYNYKKKYSTTIELHDNWPSQFPKDSYTNPRYLFALERNHERDKCKSEADKIAAEGDYTSGTAAFLIEHRYKDLDEAVNFYNSLPRADKNDGVARKLLEKFFEKKESGRAIEFFNQWPVTRHAFSYNCMLEHIVKFDLSDALKIFDMAYKENDAFKRIVQVISTDYGILVDINCHFSETMGGGTPIYSVLSFKVIQVILWYLRSKLILDIQGKMTKFHSGRMNTFIRIITGQGNKFELRTQVMNFLGVFGDSWKPLIDLRDPGSLYIERDVEFLLKDKVLMPPCITKIENRDGIEGLHTP